MITGFTKFKEAFLGFENQYVVIGGTACDLLMEEENLPFRATKDVDMVLIVEAMTKEFGTRFWEYVKEAEYEHRNKSTGESQFYRFVNPKSKDYPYMIELFSKKLDNMFPNEAATLTPLPIDDEISSLSAIILNEAYYNILKNGQIVVDGIPVLKAEYLIPFKAKAWLDLTQKKAEGYKVDGRDVKKHKNDVFRLTDLITERTNLSLSAEIKEDMKAFLLGMESEDIDLKSLGVTGTKQARIDLMYKCYGIAMI